MFGMKREIGGAGMEISRALRDAIHDAARHGARPISIQMGSSTLTMLRKELTALLRPGDPDDGVALRFHDIPITEVDGAVGFLVHAEWR